MNEETVDRASAATIQEVKVNLCVSSLVSGLSNQEPHGVIGVQLKLHCATVGDSWF